MSSFWQGDNQYFSELNKIQAFTLPRKMTVHAEDKNIFESQGNYHSTYFILNPEDKTYVYYSIFEVGYLMSVGVYKVNDKEITFNGDSEKTHDLVKDTAFYYQYYRHSTPRPFKIDDAKYLLSRKGIELVD